MGASTAPKPPTLGDGAAKPRRPSGYAHHGGCGPRRWLDRARGDLRDEALGGSGERRRFDDDAVVDDLHAVDPQGLAAQHGIGMILTTTGQPERDAESHRVVADCAHGLYERL